MGQNLCWPVFLDILYTHICRCNWYNSLLTAGHNSSCLGLTSRDATDTREADALGRNWYNFLTAGRNSYFPGNFGKIWFAGGQNEVEYTV
jgi:hypothetical protein